MKPETKEKIEPSLVCFDFDQTILMYNLNTTYQSKGGNAKDDVFPDKELTRKLIHGLLDKGHKVAIVSFCLYCPGVVHDIILTSLGLTEDQVRRIIIVEKFPEAGGVDSHIQEVRKKIGKKAPNVEHTYFIDDDSGSIKYIREAKRKFEVDSLDIVESGTYSDHLRTVARELGVDLGEQIKKKSK